MSVPISQVGGKSASSYLLSELESVDKAKGFIDGPSDREIIDSDLTITHISH